MDPESASAFAKAIAVFTMIATAPAEAYIVGKAFEAIGRNPKLENSLFVKATIAMAIAESTAIYALVAFFSL